MFYVCAPETLTSDIYGILCTIYIYIYIAKFFSFALLRLASKIKFMSCH